MLPFLPGNVFADTSITEYHKTQTLGYKNGYRVPTDPLALPNSTQEDVARLLKMSEMDPTFIYGPKRQTESNDAPVQDTGVLRFHAYFKQTVHDTIEPYLLRIVNILYYLEDDSIAVLEPPRTNSGILQGVLIKRQRLPKTSTDFFNFSDFAVGNNVTFYAKTFHIYNCDKFTRDFMLFKGHEMKQAEECPKDKYLESRKEVPRQVAPKQEDKLSRFLKHDRHVLRFYCLWPEEQRKFIMHYYLVDDSIEVLEVHTPNDGRDPCPLLLKRQPLPKTFVDLSDLKEGECYGWKDIRMGTVINVLNRRFIVFDCDAFTKNHYSQLNIEMHPLKFNDQEREKTEKVYPPYNGFGSEEDSLQSCKNLVLQPPRKPFSAIDENLVLRFVASMESKYPEDKDRKFVLSLYICDGTVSVYEPPRRNSGVVGGKFKERSCVLKPGHTQQNPVYYSPCDFYVGARIVIHSHCFVLFDADEFAYKYMESNPSIYHVASLEHAISKAKEMSNLGDFKSALEDNADRKSLDQISNNHLHLHEIITLQRHKSEALNLL